MVQKIHIPTATTPELKRLEAALLNSPSTSDLKKALRGVHEELAAREFPALDYVSYLKERHGSGKVQTYLEIGVRWGDAMKLAHKDCKAVGVDPDYKIRHKLPSDPTLFKVTSDDFFFEFTTDYQQYFDLVFIDGLHEAQQTAKDICHSVDVLKEGGEILVHDVLPISLAVSTPEQQTYFWTGNVWQAAYAICNKLYPLKWEFIPAAPSGLLRLYDIDPTFKPPRKQIMQRTREAAEFNFKNAEELLAFLREL